MNELAIPDLCAHLDRLKTLCDRLEDAQTDPTKYQKLIAQIRSEADAFQASVCWVSRAEERPLGLMTS